MPRADSARRRSADLPARTRPLRLAPPPPAPAAPQGGGGRRPRRLRRRHQRHRRHAHARPDRRRATTTRCACEGPLLAPIHAIVAARLGDW
ncbi:MAG: hypothetical protein MZW92_75690 [Comamonadaceae bacterium]|nr:hypothetical protein [Comamonadaceae bacterium]